MKSKWFFVLTGATFLLLVLASCTPTSTPTCPTGSLQAPILTGPAMWSVVGSLSPSLTWSYPDATCNPQGYAIDLSTGPFFTDDLGGGTGNPSTSWGPGSPLQPGKEYAWGVQAINGTTLGPYAGSSYFFTGPMCDVDVFAVPTLLQPANGAVVTVLDPSLIWEYPYPCLVPLGYRVDLSTDVTFADTSLSGGTGNPSTRWGPGEPLADCTVYFWKIAATNGEMLGPASGIFSFSTDLTGTCPTPTPVEPTPTPVPTSTPTPASFVFTPNINAYCRFGPDPVFGYLEIAMAGQPYLMDGRNLDSSWYRIMISPSVGCWVRANSGTPSGDISGLRVLADVPTPTPTPVPFCSNYTDAVSCRLHSPPCEWKKPPTGGPEACVNQ